MDMTLAHSEKYINKGRVLWWDPEWLRYIAKCNGFPLLKTVCDLGTGAGHWAEALAIALRWKNTTDLTVLDFEEKWVIEANKNVALNKNVKSLVAVKKDALNTGFPDGMFDLVTCQTLALHVSTPGKLVKEMIRICKSDGYVLISEPVNVINRCQIAQSIAFLHPHEAAIIFEIWLSYHRGIKTTLGYDYDIALNMKNIIKSCGVPVGKIWAAKNPKIIETAIGASGLLSEYNEENYEIAVKGGINREKWDRGIEIISKLSSDVPLVFCDGMFSFCFKKLNSTE